MRGKHRPQQLPAVEHARYVKMRLLQTDPRFTDTSDTYTFAAVDDKTKQQLHWANTRSITYSNIAVAGEGEVEDNEALARICNKLHIPPHTGKNYVLCASAVTGNSDIVEWKRCRHFLTDSLDLCPHCGD